jgi:hypothetical protein
VECEKRIWRVIWDGSRDISLDYQTELIAALEEALPSLSQADEGDLRWFKGEI